MAASASGADATAVPAVAEANLRGLPPPDTVRWVARRKAQVVNAVRNGQLTLDQACAHYRLSAEEFLAWERMIERHGLAGLRVTRLQRYRA